jgi:hypothetical protein
MRADLAARLRRTMRGEVVAETGVTGVAGVAERTGLRPKPPELRQLRRLRLKNASEGRNAKEGVSSPVTAPLANDLDAIEERAALAADCVPACYLEAWARLQCQKPASVSEAEWRRALDDGGRFLDAWGEDAAALGWMPGDLFDVTGDSSGGWSASVSRRCGRTMRGSPTDKQSFERRQQVRRGPQCGVPSPVCQRRGDKCRRSPSRSRKRLSERDPTR